MMFNQVNLDRRSVCYTSHYSIQMKNCSLATLTVGEPRMRRTRVVHFERVDSLNESDPSQWFRVCAVLQRGTLRIGELLKYAKNKIQTQLKSARIRGDIAHV